MRELVFASGNAHKLVEIRQVLESTCHVLSAPEAGFIGTLPEEQETLEGNALQKAQTLYEHLGRDCFADDTGLEVEALGGTPGVYSARYAGPNCSMADNVRKILADLEGVANRKARFRTVIALILGGKAHLFEGIVEGELLPAVAAGEQGFGYDPIFRPLGYRATFAQMPLSQKNTISHRGNAVRALRDFLQQNPA